MIYRCFDTFGVPSVILVCGMQSSVKRVLEAITDYPTNVERLLSYFSRLKMMPCHPLSFKD